MKSTSNQDAAQRADVAPSPESINNELANRLIARLTAVITDIVEDADRGHRPRLVCVADGVYDLLADLPDLNVSLGSPLPFARALFPRLPEGARDDDSAALTAFQIGQVYLHACVGDKAARAAATLLVAASIATQRVIDAVKQDSREEAASGN